MLLARTSRGAGDCGPTHEAVDGEVEHGEFAGYLLAGLQPVEAPAGLAFGVEPDDVLVAFLDLQQPLHARELGIRHEAPGVKLVVQFFERHHRIAHEDDAVFRVGVAQHILHALGCVFKRGIVMQEVVDAVVEVVHLHIAEVVRLARGLEQRCA